MGVTGNKGRGGAPTPAVVGTGRSMRARDVSKPRSTDKPQDKNQEGKGGSTPVSS